MEAAREGLYSAAIPGQRSGLAVQFYVEAKDGRGAVSTYPARGRDSRALYRVEDRQARLDAVHNFRIIMTPSDASFLHLSTNVMSNDRIGATVVYDEEEVFYDVGVRLKGSERGRDQPNRVGFHVLFPADRLFRGVHETVAVDRSGGWAFGTNNGQDEIVVKHMIQRAGDIPGSYDDLIRVIAPRNAQNGMALLQMARYGDLFLDSQYENGSDGTVFEMELIYSPTSTVDGNPESLKRPEPDQVLGLDLRDQGDDKELYRWNFLIMNQRSRDDYSGLIRVAKALSLGGAELDQRVPEVMDVDEWMRAFALMALCGIGDAYTFGNNHNLRLFVRPADERVLALPYDWDFAFVQGATAPLWGDQNLAKVINRPQFQRLFYGHIQDLIDSVYLPEYMNPWIDHYGTLAGRSYAQFKTYITQRRNFARTRVPARVPFEITTNDGADFTVDTPTVEIEGRAWIDVRSIVDAGAAEALALDWPALNRWRATFALAPGDNALSLFAFDASGTLAGDDAITVTSTFVPPRDEFKRGDATGDLLVDVSDVVRILLYLFAGQPLPCADAADVDDDEILGITDAIRLLNYIFLKGPAPSPPFPLPGVDPQDEGPLDCAS
jgi:hypothetical protein